MSERVSESVSEREKHTFIHVVVGCGLEPVAAQVVITRVPVAARDVRLPVAELGRELSRVVRVLAGRLPLGCGERVRVRVQVGRVVAFVCSGIVL